MLYCCHGWCKQSVLSAGQKLSSSASSSFMWSQGRAALAQPLEFKPLCNVLKHAPNTLRQLSEMITNPVSVFRDFAGSPSIPGPSRGQYVTGAGPRQPSA